MQQLEDAAKADYYRIRGEILTTYLGKLTAGMTEITLPNFYDDNKPLKIKLDPELSPSRNAQKYFTKYDKLKTSVDYVKEQLKLANDEINYLANIESQIDLASPADIQEIRLELQQQGYIKQKRQKSKKRRKVRVSKPEEFHTSNGTTVLVGKNKSCKTIALALRLPTKMIFGFTLRIFLVHTLSFVIVIRMNKPCLRLPNSLPTSQRDGILITSLIDYLPAKASP